MKKIGLVLVFVVVVIIVALFSFRSLKNQDENYIEEFTKDTTVAQVIHNSSFADFGEFLFPLDISIPESVLLDELEDYYTWYHYMSTDKTVEILNTMKEQVDAGHPVFYPIYTEEEMEKEPDKRNTGLFFFRGNPGSKFAILNAGGGFMYVAAMQDSFPQALEISKHGYHAFALIYRPGTDTAMEDLAQAIQFIFEHQNELQVDVSGYSVWGGSAGARMAAWLGSYGTEEFSGYVYPRPATVVMQYTGLSEVAGTEPPTYACVGTNDGIASYRVMERRINAILENGTDAEIEVFEGLPHGFGLGIGTSAEGWLDHAVLFWEKHM